MTQQKLKCIRCQGRGDVRKYIMYGCSEYFLEMWDVILSSTLYFLLFLMASFIMGGILGFFYFILLKTALPFNVFGTIFYFSGGISFLYIICIIFFNYKTIFKNTINTLVVLVLMASLGYINIKIGRYLIGKKGMLSIILNLIYAFIQGGSIGFTLIFLLFKKDMLDEVNGRTKCPLCEGNKFISYQQFHELKRCQICSFNCGYTNPIDGDFFQKRYFCDNCKGIGYFI